jgi:putative transposase
MLDFLRLFLHVLAAPLRTQAQLEAEVTLLRHQLNVLRRQAPSRPRLTAADRLLLVWLWRLFPSLRSAITIIQADTCAALASVGLSTLLAMEVAFAQRQAQSSG